MHNEALCYVNDESTCDVTHIIKWRKKTEQVRLINGSFRNYNSVDSSNEIKNKGRSSPKSGPAKAPLISVKKVLHYLDITLSWNIRFDHIGLHQLLQNSSLYPADEWLCGHKVLQAVVNWYWCVIAHNQFAYNEERSNEPLWHYTVRTPPLHACSFARAQYLYACMQFHKYWQ